MILIITYYFDQMYMRMINLMILTLLRERVPGRQERQEHSVLYWWQRSRLNRLVNKTDEFIGWTENKGLGSGDKWRHRIGLLLCIWWGMDGPNIKVIFECENRNHCAGTNRNCELVLNLWKPSHNLGQCPLFWSDGVFHSFLWTICGKRCLPLQGVALHPGNKI